MDSGQSDNDDTRHNTGGLGHQALLTVTSIPQLIDFAVSRGVQRDMLLQLANVDPPDSRSAWEVIPAERRQELFRAAATRLSHEHFGLSFARYLDVWSHNVVGLFMSTCETFGRAIEGLERYQGLFSIHEHKWLELITRGSLVHIVVQTAHPERPHSHNLFDFMLYQLLIRSRRVLGRTIEPTHIRLRDRPVERADAIRELFGATVEFGASRDELILASDALALELSSANPAMNAFLEAYIGEALERSSTSQPVSSQVRSWAAEHLAEGELSAGRVARALGMSARTLQRHLQREGSTLHTLIDQVRHEHALILLRGPMTVAQVAAELGFSEASTFHRAFKRWTGTTAGRHRRQTR